MTHLHGSAVHGRLDRRQQVRYNQLCGLMAAEQFLAFEETVIITAIRRLAQRPEVRSEPGFADALTRMIDEEVAHAGWFRTLLSSAEPALYAGGQRPFTRLRWWERLALLPLTRTHDGAVLMLWFSLLIEEHSLRLSEAMLAEADGLDPRFVAVHRRHLADEARHVPLNLKVIARCYDPLPAWRRWLLARAFRLLLRNLARPRRANVAVVRRLVQEFPELAGEEAALLHAVQVEFRDHAPRSDITHPASHPVTTQALSSRPEFAPVVADLHAGWRSASGGVIGRFATILVLQVVGSAAYLAVGAAALRRVPDPPMVPLTALDAWLPQVPGMVLVYDSLGPLLFAAAWTTGDRFRRLLAAAIATSLVAYACFLAVPLARPPTPPNASEPWRFLLAQLHTWDVPVNTLPSLHVAYVVLVLCAAGRPLARWWLTLWGLAIIVSTVLIGQHGVIDVLAGIVLAGTAWWATGLPARPSRD